VPVEFPDGLTLPVVMLRENPYDAFVSNRYAHLGELPINAIVGTASLRRQCQLLALRPDLNIQCLRGNVGTRLNKLDNGEFDAIILASAGLKRLNLENRIRTILSADTILPAIGQGAIGIECRHDDEFTQEIIAQLNDSTTFSCVTAERAINATLGGSCQVPIAGFAEISGETMTVRGLVGNPDGSEILRSSIEGVAAEAEILGKKLAQHLLDQGAERLLSMN
jgi:hydroxymethylbilane synthase